jgi:hypothetical protein
MVFGVVLNTNQEVIHFKCETANEMTNGANFINAVFCI